MDCDYEHADDIMKSFKRAKEIVFAKHAAESFTVAVRHSIEDSLKEGLSTNDEIEKLVGQICYRAADFSYLLELEDKKPSHYSEYLRQR